MCVRVRVHARADSLSRGPLQESLHRDDQLTQEALDDWPALGKLILHLDLQHVRHQSHEGVLLHRPGESRVTARQPQINSQLLAFFPPVS